MCFTTPNGRRLTADSNFMCHTVSIKINHLQFEHDSMTYPLHDPQFMVVTRALEGKMSAHGVSKEIVGIYRLYSDTAFERHRSRVPINDDVYGWWSLWKHLIEFLERNWKRSTVLGVLTSNCTGCPKNQEETRRKNRKFRHNNRCTMAARAAKSARWRKSQRIRRYGCFLISYFYICHGLFYFWMPDSNINFVGRRRIIRLP